MRGAASAVAARETGEPDDGLDVAFAPTRRVGQPGGGSATLGIVVDPDLQAASVAVELSATGRASLRSDASTSIDVPVEGLVAELVVDYVVAGGEGSVVADVDALDASGSPVAGEVMEVFLLEDDDELLAGNAGRTALALEAFERHEADALTPTERTARRAELLDGETSLASVDVGAAAVDPGADEVGVAGTVEWTDEDGVTHPYRFAEVQVWEDDGLLVDEVIATTTTDANGDFEVVVDNDDGIGQGGRDLFVRARTVGTGFTIEVDGDPYSLRSPTQSDAQGGVVYVFAITGVETDEPGWAMSVHQAMAAAVPYVTGRNGAALPDVPVVYPNGADGSFFDGTSLQIELADRWDWDTIHHEYGHFVAAELEIEDNPGGPHNLGDNLSEVRGSKDVGTRLAWGEAWPTYFALSLQREEALAALGVPRVGDERYQALEAGGSHIDYSIEDDDGGGAPGEDNEVAVQRILWDLYDDDQDDGDEVELGDGVIWDAIDGSDPVRLSDAWQAITGTMEPADVARAGCIVSEWGVAPTPTAPVAGARFAPDADPPTFAWTAGGGGPAFQSDEFVVEFRTGPEDRLLFSSPVLDTPEFTPTDAQWDMITSRRDVSWSVSGTQTDAPETGPYRGCSRRMVASQGPGSILDRAGCRADVLARNDDGSTGVVALGFDVDFFGATYDSVYVNNNGNVTFDTPLSTFTPFPLLSTSRVIVAPFFADVDTRNPASGVVTYGQTTYGARDALCINWVDVGYYSSSVDRLNSFQLLLIDRSDLAPGDFDIMFNVDQVQWETGSASGGVGGLGGSSARVGYASSGFDALELDGSGINGAFLDTNPESGLVHGSLNSTQLGRYVFRVRSGDATGVAVSGTVTDESGAVVAGAPVDVCAAAGGCVSSSTAANGQYLVEPVPPGTYSIRVASPAGRDLSTEVVPGIEVADTDVVVDVVLSGPNAPPAGTTIVPSRSGGSVPVVYYDEDLALRTEACAGGAAAWAITVDGAEVAAGTLAEGPSGIYVGTVAPLTPVTGYAEVTIDVACPDGSSESVSFDIYIDPSGTVLDLQGQPVVGATVTLLRADSPNGPFEVVPDGSAIMSPANRANPMETGEDGRFGWDTIAGYYVVRAEASGCVNPVAEDETAVESAVLPVPPPQLGIELVLDCGEPPTAEALVLSLIEVIDAIDTGPPGIVTSLSGKLHRALDAIVVGDPAKACRHLQAFRSQAAALSDKFLAGVTSVEVVATADEAAALLGCT